MFPENERKCFRYYDGRREVYGDPLQVRRKLILACGGDFTKLWNEYFFNPGEKWPDSEDDRYTAEEKSAGLLRQALAGETLIPAARLAFGMDPVDPDTGEGGAEEDCDRALVAWGVFCEELKKKRETRASPTSSSSATASPTGP